MYSTTAMEILQSNQYLVNATLIDELSRSKIMKDYLVQYYSNSWFFEAVWISTRYYILTRTFGFVTRSKLSR